MIKQQRQELREFAAVFRKDLGWWTVDEFSRFAKRWLVEINAARAHRGDWKSAAENLH